MSLLKNDRFIRALLRQPLDSTPVWMMRQAGRYLPEYRDSRAQAGDFLSLCKNTDLACEVTLQPLRRFALDAAILFSDILTVPDALGLGLYFEAGEGPKFKKTIRTEKDIANLPKINVAADGSVEYPPGAQWTGAIDWIFGEPVDLGHLYD
jgi:uroporphyrinogen decarboxylase